MKTNLGIFAIWAILAGSGAFAQSYNGYVDSADCNYIQGWAWNYTDTEIPSLRGRRPTNGRARVYYLSQPATPHKTTNAGNVSHRPTDLDRLRLSC